MKAEILIIDDEESILYTFERFLQIEGYSVTTAKDYSNALKCINNSKYDLIYLDIVLDTVSGLDMLDEIKKRDIKCPVVMITGYPSVETSREALRLGAFDYIPKPVHPEELLHVTRMALRHEFIEEQNRRYERNLRAIFRSVKDAIITVDRELKLLDYNESAKRICSISKEIESNRPYLKSILERCDGECLEELEKAIKNEEYVELNRIECSNMDRPNQILTISISPLIGERNEFSGAVMVVRDETRLAELERSLENRHRFHNIIGKSESMQRIYSLIEKLSQINTTVLITGETGTGKELVAEAIHYMGGRGKNPIIKVNCSALSESLLESELFGHVRGAFTGAVHNTVGKFQSADKGTILLDEISDITPKVQHSFLRVLEKKEFTKVGDASTIQVDVRVIAATNKDLKNKVINGEFREDLYYRLKVVEIQLPPLRDHREDIPLMIEHFLSVYSNEFKKEIHSLSSEVVSEFMNYHWPGNVRELKHIIEHACIVCQGEIITMNDLPNDFTNHTAPPEKDDDIELIDIGKVLEKTGGNKAKAARILGMSRTTLYKKLEKMKNI